MSRKEREVSGRAVESALLVRSGSVVAHVCLSAAGSCFYAEPDIHLLSQADKSHRRRLSLCSLPVPKQCKESLRSLLRRRGDLRQDLAVCASNDLDVLFFHLSGKVLRCCGWHELAGRGEFCFAPVYGQQICHHLSGNRQRCPIGISSLSFALIEHRKFLTISRREPSCLDQDCAGYAYCAAWRSASASPCPPSVSPLRTVRSS
jgi:hypothetical protein